jgi:type IV pilus assembly protein PilZ
MAEPSHTRPAPLGAPASVPPSLGRGEDPLGTRPAPLGGPAGPAAARPDERLTTRPANLGPPQQPAGAAAAPSRPSVIQLMFREKGALYAAYIPLLAEGGLFVPTTRDYRIGDDIYLLLSLPDDPQRFPVAGKVAWVTPANASGGRTQGVGVRFPNDEKARQLKVKIEETLGTTLQGSKPTQTI